MNVLPYNNEIPDEHIAWLFARMVETNLVQTVFPAGEVITYIDWVDRIKERGRQFYMVVDEETVVAVAWIDGFQHNHCWAHFVSFPEIWGTRRTVDAGKMLLNRWFSYSHNTRPFFDVILARVPETNKRIIRYIKKLGFTTIGSIPGIGLDIYRGEKPGIVMAYIKREDHE